MPAARNMQPAMTAMLTSVSPGTISSTNPMMTRAMPAANRPQLRPTLMSMIITTP